MENLIKVVVIGIAVLVSTGLVSSEELNLSEANVMDVSKNNKIFSATLLHDDNGEDGYANWWQVETLEGKKLGRRKLLHAHGTRNFTRSKKVIIPNNISEIVVRAHDQTHGYGGKAAIFDLRTQETEYIYQGSKPESFSPVTGSNSTSQKDSQNKDFGTSKDRSGNSNTSDGIISSLTGLINSFLP